MLYNGTSTGQREGGGPATDVPILRFDGDNDGDVSAAVGRESAADQYAAGYAPPRNERAADVVVDGAGREMAETGTPTMVDAGAAAPGGTGTRRRRMGEVYSIMKNTIYSDEECEEEVSLTGWDCGALFIRYLNGLFQYFVRNPKAMGLILTTAIILLFFKYSQQVVVKAVNAAVKAHPGLEPTDIMRSAVVTFTEELRGLERVARTIGWAYERDGVVGYDINTAIDSTFFSLVNSFQMGFTANVKTYVVYALPAAASATVHWGQIGCAAESTSSSTCFYVGSDSTARQWNITTNSAAGGASVSNAYIEERMPELLTVAATATQGSALAASGVWTRPSMTTRIFSQQTVRTISYLLPIAFDSTGSATAMAGIDVSVELLMDTVNVTATPNIEVIVVDNRYNTDEGGQFVYDSLDESLFWSVPYGMLEVPVERIRDLAQPILHENNGVLAVNGSFYQNGLIYQSLTMMTHWTLIASSPLALSVAEIVSTLRAIVKEGKSIGAAATSLYRDCETAANKQVNSATVESFGQIEQAFGTQLHSLYTSYVLTGSTSSSSSGSGSGSGSSVHSSSSSSSSSSYVNHTSSTAHPSPTSSSSSSSRESTHHNATSSSSASSSLSHASPSSAVHETQEAVQRSGVYRLRAAAPLEATASTSYWGVCGCTYSSSSQTTCFYTATSQLETIFDGSVFDESAKDKITTRNITTSRRGNFTAEYIAGTTTTTGFWTTPYLSNDTVTSSVFVAVSYVYPSAYDSNGTVTRAVVVDTTASWMAEALQANQHAGTTAMYLIDRRDAGTFIASTTSTAALTEVYPALSTPDQTYNDIANSVYSMAGNTWEKSFSFHIGPTLVNYEVVEGQWGVIEVMPGDVALERYLPTPAVTGATDALRLLPAGATVELFLYVGGILFIFFLNLLILGCSHLGE